MNSDKSAVDIEAIKEAVRTILKSVGEDPDRPGLKETPRRVARMYEEMFAGLHANPARHLQVTFPESYDEMVFSHLGMTGSWRKDTQRKLHDHIVLRLKSGTELIYNDPRRFGVFDIIAKETLEKDKKFVHLGPEPLLNEDFHGAYMFSKSRRRRVPIKAFIMDQKVVVGVGNIYASEALFLAGIRPLASASRITKIQSEKLVAAIQQVLKDAIRLGGSSIRDYKQASGESGGFQEQHFVYGRDKQACRKCRGLIRSQFLSGRNTFWCVKCQK